MPLGFLPFVLENQWALTKEHMYPDFPFSSKNVHGSRTVTEQSYIFLKWFEMKC